MGDEQPKTPQEKLSFWRGEVSRAREIRKQWEPWWDANLKAYAPQASDAPDTYGSKVNTNRDFTLVERKKADLFYQRPDVACVPSPLFRDQAPLLKTHEDILNEKLGLDGVNAKRLAHQALFDVLNTAGTGFTVMGYESVTVDVEVEATDPVTGLPALDPSGAPVRQTVPVPVFEDCFWKHVSPKQALVPQDFRSTDWDEAPWLGYEFELPLRVAKRRWNLPDDFKGGKPSQQTKFDHGMQMSPGDEVVTGQVLFYKSSIYRDDIQHPQHLTKLVLIEGLEKPAEEGDYKDQTFDAQGRLTPDSMIGYPIHPLSIRSLTDAAWVPSDCSVSRPLVNELNVYRRQQVEFRDANVLRWMYNTDTMPPEALEKIVRSPIGGMIGVPGEAYVGEGAIKELPHGSIPRENFTAHDYLDNDLARTHAIDQVQAGAGTTEGKTATEMQLQQSNVNARLDFERGIVLDWYVKGVTKYSTLVQRYLPVEQAARIVGPEAAQQWDGWRKTVPASLAFTAQPDSALRTDLAWERKRAMDEYTFFANDPFINRLELLKALMPKLHYPAKVVNEQPPQKQAEAAKPSFSFKGEDLNPLAPQFAIVMDILAQSGLQVNPAAVQEAQAAAQNSLLLQQVQASQAAASEGQPETAHGGKVAQMEGLSKHAVDQTGGMQGSGQPAPMGAGGMQ